MFERLKSMFVRPEPEARSMELPSQKRRATRMLCQYKVECTSNGKKFDAVVRDISLTGMKLEVPKAVPVGSTLAIRYQVAPSAPRYTNNLDIDTVNGLVVWCTPPRAGNGVTLAGLSHSDEEEAIARSWIYHVLRELGLSKSNVKERRKYARIPCCLPASLGAVDSEGVRGLVLDLSEDGCYYEGDMTVRDGTRVRLNLSLPDLPSLVLEGRAVHNRKLRDGCYKTGVQFAALSNREVLRLRRYLLALLSQSTESIPTR